MEWRQGLTAVTIWCSTRATPTRTGCGEVLVPLTTTQKVHSVGLWRFNHENRRRATPSHPLQHANDPLHKAWVLPLVGSECVHELHRIPGPVLHNPDSIDPTGSEGISGQCWQASEKLLLLAVRFHDNNATKGRPPCLCRVLPIAIRPWAITALNLALPSTTLDLLPLAVSRPWNTKSSGM
jgi:hypothetical protein